MQSLMARAEEFGCGDLVVEDQGEWFPTQELENRAEPYIDEFVDQSMWEELIDRLARRDAQRAIGRAALEQLPLSSRFQVLGEHAAPWAEEFEQRGLTRLTIDAQQS